jgi:hypothetical protein
MITPNDRKHAILSIILNSLVRSAVSNGPTNIPASHILYQIESLSIQVYLAQLKIL